MQEFTDTVIAVYTSSLLLGIVFGFILGTIKYTFDTFWINGK